MSIDNPSPASPWTSLLDRIEASRDGETFGWFAAGGALVLLFAGFAVGQLHFDAYAVNVKHGIAIGGALVTILLSLATSVAVAVLYSAWPRPRWKVAAIAGTAVVVLLGLLPPVTGRDGWLTVLLFLLITLTYQAFAAAWFALVLPWRQWLE